MKEIKKDKLEFWALILFVIFGFGYSYFSFLLMPEWNVIQNTTSQLAVQKSNYQELLAYQRNQNGLQQEIKATEQKVLELNSRLPNRIDNPQMMVGLYTLAKQHSLIPQSIAFEQVKNKGTYQEVGMNFSCSGQTPNILTLIQELQSGGSQHLTIESINLVVTEGIMRADLKLTAYSSAGSANGSVQKPNFMNTPIGVGSPSDMFQR